MDFAERFNLVRDYQKTEEEENFSFEKDTFSEKDDIIYYIEKISLILRKSSQTKVVK